MIYLSIGAISLLCISLLLDYVHPNKKHYFNSTSELNYNMPETDQSQATDSLLIAWVKTQLGSLYHGESATEETDFKTTFNSAFSENSSIHINHEQITRNELEDRMGASRSALARPSTIEWKEILEIPTKSDEITTSAVRIYTPPV